MALQAPRKFAQDKPQLQKAFYALSRALHPDRFSTSADESVRRASLERMSLINEAYRTLTTSDLLREYVLELEGVKAPEQGKQKAQIPLQLAESWFEIQDALAEEPAQALHKIGPFEAELTELSRAADEKLVSLEREYDRTPAKDILESLSREIQARSYLKSLARDVERIKSRLSTGAA